MQQYQDHTIQYKIVLILKKQRTYLQEIHNGFKPSSTDASNVFESLNNVKTMTFSFLILLY